MGSYQRKTRDEYQILVCYDRRYGFEEVCTEETWKEARKRAREYLENEPGYPVRVVCKRVPIQNKQEVRP